MKSIFDHKQYDLVFSEGGYTPKTVLTREINDIEWYIYPIVDDGKNFHERDFNLGLIGDNVDTDNYRLVYRIGNKMYSYTNGTATITKTRFMLKTKEDIIDIDFNGLCELIKKEIRW